MMVTNLCMLPLVTGLVLMFVYVWLCLGFHGVKITPMPLVILIFAGAVGPWYS